MADKETAETEMPARLRNFRRKMYERRARRAKWRSRPRKEKAS
jgi:hypothetical protein